MGVDGVSIFMQRKSKNKKLKNKKQKNPASHFSLSSDTEVWTVIQHSQQSNGLSFPRNAKGFPIIMCGHLDTVFPKLLAYGLEVCAEVTS